MYLAVVSGSDRLGNFNAKASNCKSDDDVESGIGPP